ncbi:thiamine pyrophosphate-binding protein [Halomarina rubra]|uniref:Thiamine pyrophosphate-binding protein n=1 Tax=Halomarina rubra TaxID=2071873 RepID=A0ABD6B0Z9_9EURY|nr:thiamine pyrophosphate-binding protein [Halomarina rubra]
MNTAELLVDCLEAEGVDYVFGLPGEETEDLLFAMDESSVDFVPVRHEQGAAFMADVHGRLTGDAGVCLSTLGPGATNLLTGVADAHLDKSPLVAITGQGGRERLHQESHQLLDVVEMFGPITKWNTRLDDPDVVHESVRKAFKLAEHEKPGATHLELPEDVAAAETTAAALTPGDRAVHRSRPDPERVDAALSVVREAERPLVLAGNGAVRSRASEQLRTFVDDTDIPVVATYMGKGAVSDRDEQSLMTLDSGSGEVDRVIERADAVVAIGYDIAEHDPESWNPEGDKRVVHLDAEPAEVYEHYVPDVELVCDVAAGIEAFCAADLDAVDTDWYADLRQGLVGEVSREPEADEPVTVARTLPLLREAMADDDVLISDVGSHKMAIAQSYPTFEPNTCLISNGLASMGIAVPGAVAADVALSGSTAVSGEDDTQPDGEGEVDGEAPNVVAATGDGGFLMNAAELETARRLDCSFTVVLFVDDDYGLISEKQEDHRGASTGTRLGNPDFVTFAESFGVEAYRPETWSEVRETLDEVVGSDSLSLVEIRLDE